MRLSSNGFERCPGVAAAWVPSVPAPSIWRRPDCFGATALNERVVIDGNLVSAAGVTAGIDGALTIASLLRGREVAQQIQLDIQYAPEPPFSSGTPETAPPAVFATVSERYKPLTQARRITAERIGKRLGLLTRR
jgi:cyclohexyl-isocyanide hydratase